MDVDIVPNAEPLQSDSQSTSGETSESIASRTRNRKRISGRTRHSAHSLLSASNSDSNSDSVTLTGVPDTITLTGDMNKGSTGIVEHAIDFANVAHQPSGNIGIPEVRLTRDDMSPTFRAAGLPPIAPLSSSMGQRNKSGSPIVIQLLPKTARNPIRPSTVPKYVAEESKPVPMSDITPGPINRDTSKSPNTGRIAEATMSLLANAKPKPSPSVSPIPVFIPTTSPEPQVVTSPASIPESPSQPTIIGAKSDSVNTSIVKVTGGTTEVAPTFEKVMGGKGKVSPTIEKVTGGKTKVSPSIDMVADAKTKVTSSTDNIMVTGGKTNASPGIGKVMSGKINVSPSSEKVMSGKTKESASIQSIKLLVNLSKSLFPNADHPVSAQKIEDIVLSLHKDNQSLAEQNNSLKARESELLFRLVQKERDVCALESRVKEAGAKLDKEMVKFRAQYMDPVINQNFRRLARELEEAKANLKLAHDEIKAAEFSSKSATGRQLIQKCRSLQEENEELGRQIAECEENKTLAKLALQQEYAKELNATLQESNQFVVELDEEVMSQQATINELRQKLQKYESSAADSSVVKMSE
eukprot:457095_1